MATTISGMTAATAANITGTALLEMVDTNGNTVKVTGAKLRTQVFAGGTGYALTDALGLGITPIPTPGGALLKLVVSADASVKAPAIGIYDSGVASASERNWMIGLSVGAYGALGFYPSASRGADPGTTAAMTLDGVTLAAALGGNLSAVGTMTNYNNVATAGLGVAPIYGSGRVGPITNSASGTIATYTPTADGTFMVGANVLITTASTHNFTVTVGYTDEGNTARVLTFTFSTVGGVLATPIINTGGAVPYEGVPMVIRTKANVAITIQTAAGGTYSNVVYNASAYITQIAA